MPGKKKSAKGSARSRKSTGTGKKKGKKSGKASSKSRLSTATESPQGEVDMLNPHAMENLYYIAHGAVDALEMRGFGWEDAPKGKKGKKGKKKK